MKLFKSIWVLVVMIPVIGWLGFSFIKINLQENIVNKEVGDLESKVGSLEKENGILERFIEYVKYPSFLEKEARLKLNYKAPGEEVVFVYPDGNSRSSSSIDFNNQLAQMPNLFKWWYYLLGY